MVATWNTREFFNGKVELEVCLENDVAVMMVTDTEQTETRQEDLEVTKYLGGTGRLEEKKSQFL